MFIAIGSSVMLAGDFLILTGGSLLSAWAVREASRRLLRTSWPTSYDLPLGFGLFAVLLSYIGFLDLGKIQVTVSALGIVCAAYGAWRIVLARKRFFPFLREWRVWAIPAVIVALMIISKLWHVTGGMGDGDEPRTFLLTSAFANNGLKPAYPFDFSLPIIYPYYLFEIAGFLYGAFGGFFFPGTAISATVIFCVGLMYMVLYLACRRVFSVRPQRKFFLASLFLSFPDARYVISTLTESAWISKTPLTQMSDFLHSGSHYLWGCALSLIGIHAFSKFLTDDDWNECFLAVLCLGIGFGFMAIPSLWIAVGLGVFALCFLLRHPARWMRFVSKEAIAPIAIGLFVWLPQIATAFPRPRATFSFSWPHFWFSRSAEVIAESGGILPQWFLEFLFGPVTIIVAFGLFLAIGAAVGAFVFFRRPFRDSPDPEWRALRPFCAICAMGAVLLTITDSISGDWYGRGFLAVTFCASLIAAKIFSPVFFERRFRTLMVICCIPLAVYASSTTAEHLSRRVQPLSPLAQSMNEMPLGTAFFETNKDAWLIDAFVAGRLGIWFPQAGYQAYLPNPDILKAWFGVDFNKHFLPCTVTWYGDSTPLHMFYVFPRELHDGPVTCDEWQELNGEASWDLILP